MKKNYLISCFIKFNVYICVLLIIKYFKMPKLSKTKSFSVSPETIEVDFKGTITECANLLKSGITNQTIVLVAHADKWHEVEISDLRIDDDNFLENSHLPSFENYVQVHNISLVDLGIIKESEKTDYTLKHDDFMQLQTEFPEFNYIDISKLHEFESKHSNRPGLYHRREDLNFLKRDNLTINQYIENSMKEKSKSLTETKPTEKQLESVMELEITEGNQLGIPVEKIEVHQAVILPETKTEAPAAPVVKKPISIQVFETLTPERISELQGLNERQLTIVKENPVIEITDKTSYEFAKKTAAILLKASTSVDGKEGVQTLGVKYLNSFKDLFKKRTDVIAKITRDPYDQQKTIISSWENAELLREQAEQRAKLAKIKLRTDELFAVPFNFNGTIYSIGTIYCTPSQVETATDEDFEVIVDNGKSIKLALDAETAKQSALADENAELKRRLALLEGMSNTEPEAPAIKPDLNHGNDPVVKMLTDNHSASAPALNPINISENQKIATPSPLQTYVLPAQENTLLNKLDLEHAEHLEKPAYLKCRGYYIRGVKELATEVQKILNDNAPNAVKKSERIDNLCNIILKSE